VLLCFCAWLRVRGGASAVRLRCVCGASAVRLRCVCGAMALGCPRQPANEHLHARRVDGDVAIGQFRDLWRLLVVCNDYAADDAALSSVVSCPRVAAALSARSSTAHAAHVSSTAHAPAVSTLSAAALAAATLALASAAFSRAAAAALSATALSAAALAASASPPPSDRYLVPALCRCDPRRHQLR